MFASPLLIHSPVGSASSNPAIQRLSSSVLLSIVDKLCSFKIPLISAIFIFVTILKNLHNVYTHALIRRYYAFLECEPRVRSVYSRECLTRMPHNKRITLTHTHTRARARARTHARTHTHTFLLAQIKDFLTDHYL